MRVSVVVSALLVIGGVAKLWHSSKIPASVSPSGLHAADIKEDDVSKVVGNLLRSHRVLIFSKSYCGFSLRAKGVLTQHLGEGGFTAVELDQRDDGGDIQDVMLRLTGARTVPRVWVDGAFIGGADDVAALDASGKLAALLKERGIL